MFLTGALAAHLALEAADLLPDLQVLDSFLSQAFVSTNNPELPAGQRALRLSTGVVNMGQGRLELRGGEVIGNQQKVYQRVFQSDGGFYDRQAGWFIFHPGHGHIHFEGWSQFLLRKRAQDGGIGEVVATGSKTSSCVIEVYEWDSTLPGHFDLPNNYSCDQIQGLRPGWADVYGYDIEGQYIDLAGIPDGQYWLQGLVDPNGQILESKRGNNSAFAPINIGTTPPAFPDPYEQNNSRAEVDSKPPGGPNSPNFGTLKMKKSLDSLSMHDNEDWFKFEMTKTGESGDYVRIQSPWTVAGNMSLSLYDGSGTFLTQSINLFNYEQISLKSRPAGWYYVRVFRAANNSTPNPEYWLTIDPAGPPPPFAHIDPPSIEWLGEGRGPYVEQAFESIPVCWEYVSEKCAAKTTTVFRCQKADGSDAQSIAGYEKIPGHIKAVNVLTVKFPVGRWRIFVRFESGDGFFDAWKENEIFVYRKGDTNMDGKVTVEEAQALYHKYLEPGKKLPTGWDKICDMDRDGDVDNKDYRLMYKAAEHGD